MAKKIVGTVRRMFTTRNGPAYVIALTTPVLVDGHEESEVSVGALKGFQMALQASGVNELRVGDVVHIEATGAEPAKEKGQSERVNFAVEVGREGKIYKGRTEDAQVPFLDAGFWEVS
jgi:hypothetical protein